MPEDKPDDPINPSHYKQGGVEVISAIEAWCLGFNLGQVVKYVARAGKKPGEPAIVDLKKALWYLKRQIDFLEGKTDA